MSTQVMFGLPPIVRQAFRRYRRHWRFVSTARGLLLTAAMFAGSVGVAVVADRLLRLSSPVRVVFLAGISVAVFLCMIRLVLWFAVRPMGNREAAIRLGRRFPQRQEDLVSAGELSAGEGAMPGVSRSLVASALEQIGARAERIDGRASVPLRRLWKILAAFSVLAAALAVVYLLRPEAVGNALNRLYFSL